MAEQIQKSKQTQESAPEEQELEVAQVDEEKLLGITDDILDEIDSILEEDAETFVRAYVQKGGE